MLVGGIAVYMHVTRSTEARLLKPRYSDDVDIDFISKVAIPDDIQVLFTDDAGSERTIVLDRNYSSAIALIHPDAQKDSLEFMFSSNRRLELRLISALDLAVTKTGRFADHDQYDLKIMAEAGLIDVQPFRHRATEALDYYATDPTHVKMNIEQAAELIRRHA